MRWCAASSGTKTIKSQEAVRLHWLNYNCCNQGITLAHTIHAAKKQTTAIIVNPIPCPKIFFIKALIPLIRKITPNTTPAIIGRTTKITAIISSIKLKIIFSMPLGNIAQRPKMPAVSAGVPPQAAQKQ